MFKRYQGCAFQRYLLRAHIAMNIIGRKQVGRLTGKKLCRNNNPRDIQSSGHIEVHCDILYIICNRVLDNVQQRQYVGLVISHILYTTQKDGYQIKQHNVTAPQNIPDINGLSYIFPKSVWSEPHGKRCECKAQGSISFWLSVGTQT